MSYHQVTIDSNNDKTGRIPVTRSSSDTCPPSCPLMDEDGNGPCYANGGRCRIHRDRINAAVYASVTDYTGMVTEIAAIDPVTCEIFRHDEFGDLAPEANNPNRIDAEKARQLCQANALGGNRGGFTYTHHAVFPNRGYGVTVDDAEHNRRVIADMIADGFMVNLSADNLEEADDMAGLGIAPVTAILPQDAGPCKTPKGRNVSICPATTLRGIDLGITCKTCKICQKWHKTILGLKAHGVAKRKLSEMVR